MTRTSREVPLEHPFLGWRDFRVIWKNLIAIHTRRSNSLDFLHIPPAMSQGLPEQWSIPRLQFEVSYYTAYPPENILVVAEEQTERWVDANPRLPSWRLIMCRDIRIHLLNLLDGSPHRVPRSNVLTLPLPPGVGETYIQVLAMTGSRLMLHISLQDESWPHKALGRRLVLWNWRTGDTVRML